MAENKKAVVVYADWISTFDKLSDQEAGRLIKYFFKYINDMNPEAPDRLTELLFEPIKSTLRRDLRKYEEIRQKRSDAGRQGGRPTIQEKQTKAKKANALFDKQTKAKKAVSVSVSVSDSVSVLNIPPTPPMGESEISTSGISDSIPKEKEKEKKVPAKKEKETGFDLSFVDVVYKSIVKDFIEYRKQIKKPYKTVRGVEMFYSELLKLSNNNLQKAKQLVDYAKGKEWQTVYEIKDNGTNQRIGTATKERDLESLARNIEQGIIRGSQRRS